MPDEEEVSEGGTGELEGHSMGSIMQAGIRAPTTASLVGGEEKPNEDNGVAATMPEKALLRVTGLGRCVVGLMP